MKEFFSSKSNLFKLSIFLLLCGVFVFTYWMLFVKVNTHAKAAWFNDAWTYRVAITIGNTGSADGNKKVLLDIDTATLITAGKMQSDCGDSRFTDATGKVLSYYIDTAGGACNGASTDYYVLMESIPNGSSIIYHYYGNSTVANGTEGTQFSHSTFSPTSGPTAATEEVGQAPIASWNFDEGYGTTARDSIGSNNGTLSNGPVWQQESSCIRSKCLYFDGSGGYTTITNPTDNSLNPTTALTISAWINPKSDGESDNGRIVANVAGVDVYVKTDDNSAVNLCAQTSGVDDTCLGSDAIPLNQWTYISIVYTNANTRNFYLNGKFITTNNSTNSLTTYAFNKAIGGDTQLARSFHGYIDEVKIYRYARTAAQVKQDYVARGSIQGVSAQIGNSTTNTTQRLMGYWALDTATGTLAPDLSGNNNNGTLANGPTWTTGKYGNGINLDGTNDSISVPNSSTLNPGNNFTISAWLKTTVGSVYGQVVNKQHSSGNVAPHNGLIYRVYINVNDLNCQAFNGSTNILVSTDGTAYDNIVQTNTWVHVTCTLDGSYLKMYVNGVYANQTAWSGSVPTNNTGTFYIGARTITTASYFPGVIDEVRLYNYVRSADQILLDMNNGSPYDTTITDYQIGYWKFDEGYGTTVNSSTTTNITGTLTSGPVWTNSGKYGKAIQFDGTDDYINLPDDPLWDGTSMTLSGWFYPTSFEANDKLFNRDDGASSRFWQLYISDTSGNVRFLGSAPTAWQYDMTTTTSLTLNRWNHVAVMFDASTDTGYIYINGKLAASDTASGDMAGGTRAIEIGGSSIASSSFNGSIDEVKFYSKALTSNQIGLEYNQNKALVLGSTSTGSGGTTPDNSAARQYCVPGDNASCSAPVGEWLLNENTGTTAYDTTANALNGTLTSGPQWKQGVHGSSILFDGTDDVVSVSHNTSLNAYPLTIETWFKTGMSSGLTGIVNKYVSSSLNGYQLFIDSGNVCAWYFKDSSNYVWDGTGCTLSTAGYNNNAWHHAAFVVDSSGGRLYIDGVLKGSQSWTGSAGATTTTQGISMGYYPSNSYFSGYVDQVRIYNYARTPAQIVWSYNKGAPLAWYKLDECQGTTAYNYVKSPNGTAAGGNGTINIGASGTQTAAGTCTGASNEAWKDGATGKYGASLDFDGTDDNVTITNSAFAVGTGDFSYALWVKLNNPSDANNRVFSVGGNANTYETWINSSQQIFSHAGDAVSSRSGATSSQTLSTGVWYHIVAVYDRDVAVYQYINGILEKTQSGITSYSGTSYSSSTGEIGGYAAGTAFNFDGQIDDVRFYNYVLNTRQIKEIMNNGAVYYK